MGGEKTVGTEALTQVQPQFKKEEGQIQPQQHSAFCRPAPRPVLLSLYKGR